METTQLSIFLPEDLLAHFTIICFEQLDLIETKQECFHTELEEKNELPHG